MGNYFHLLHPADHAGGRASRQEDGHGTTMYSDVEAEAMVDCALEAMKVQSAAMEIAIQRYSRNNEIDKRQRLIYSVVQRHSMKHFFSFR